MHYKMVSTKYPEVSIIALCYNEKAFQDTLLKSIKQLNYPGKIQTLLVDNNSSDGSAAYVKKNYSWVKVIENKENVGTPGFNLAIPHLTGKYVVWVGSDTKFDKNAIKIMVDYLEKHEKVGGLYPQVVDFEGKYLEGWYCFSRTLYFFSTLEKTESKEYSAIGPGMLRKDILDKIGYIYDPDYFYSYEDVDLCLRIKMLGYIIEYHRDALLYHRGSISFNKRNKPAKLIFLGDRNALITFFKINSIGTLLVYFPYTLFFRLLIMVKELVTLQPLKAFARLRAIVWVFFHMGMVLRKRRQVQSYRKVSDRFIYSFADEGKFIREGFKKLFTRETFDVQQFHTKHRKSVKNK
jgi:GT2 family glycosyltransferase